MPRLARVVISGVPHHVVQRGNNRQDVFFVDDDRRVYLALLREQCERYGAAVVGYCLMTNHIHLIIRPETEASLAQAVGRTHFRYTQYVNQLHGRSGHLWQGRFSSCALGEDHFWAALGYVERNPVRAKLVNAAWQYAWSSAAAHTGEADPSGLLDAREWSERMDGKAWRALLRRRDDKDAATTLRNATHRGWPLATDGFVAKFEKLLNRRLRPLPIGRPRRAPVKKTARKQKNNGDSHE